MANGELILTNNHNGECLLCGGSPSEEGRTLEMIHAVGMDVNYGEEVNICQGCAGVMADLIGRKDEESFRKLETDLAHAEGELQSLRQDHEAQSSRVSKILEGRKALREEREAVKADV